MGVEYLLPYSFVIVFSINIYFGAVFEMVYKYRCAFGDYKQDRWFMVMSAVMNIIVSIAGAKFFGVTGVIVGTLIAYIPIALGRIRFVVKNYFGKPMSKYLIRHCILFLIAAVEAVILALFTKNIPINIAGLFLRGIIWLLIPLFISVPIFYKNKYFCQLLEYLKKITKIITSKIKR